MMGLGPTELAVILGLAVILFGGGRLADIGAGLGQGIRRFKEGLRDTPDDHGPRGGDGS